MPIRGGLGTPVTARSSHPHSASVIDHGGMALDLALDLFAGIPVTASAAALPWYETLLGGPPSFLPTDTEAVWELAEHRFVSIVQDTSPRQA
jgi:predicted dehydrogenase